MRSTEAIDMRPWRDIAREIATEQDPDRLLELCHELTKSFDAQERQVGEPSSPQPPRVDDTGARVGH